MSERLQVEVLKHLPKTDDDKIRALLAAELEKQFYKIVVLDDDPTGVQTVHDVSVYTDWSEESIRSGFAEKNRLFYILTNSRSFTPAQTETVHREIAETVAKVADGREFILISRSDSTLRGHYPLETRVLREVLEAKTAMRFDGEVLIPFFLEGGRYTIGNVHYVRMGDELVPAAETEFARDKTFGYTKSDMREYIEEKTGGAYPASSVTAIPLDMLAAGDAEGVKNLLMHVTGFGKVIVNAASYSHVRTFCAGLYRAMAAGKRFLFRSAAGFVKELGGVTDQPLLTGAQLRTDNSGRGGIVVAGSHTSKTTDQLHELMKLAPVVPIPFNSDLVLEGDEALDAEVARCVKLEEEAILAGKVAVCYTNRKLLSVENDTPESALLRSVKISTAVQALVGRLTVTPAFVVAKGGITSSDVGVKALQVRRADVMGQIVAGVPVWRTGVESRFPGIPYVIFPGNVGDAYALRQAVEKLIQA